MKNKSITLSVWPTLFFMLVFAIAYTCAIFMTQEETQEIAVSCKTHDGKYLKVTSEITIKKKLVNFRRMVGIESKYDAEAKDSLQSFLFTEAIQIAFGNEYAEDLNRKAKVIERNSFDQIQYAMKNTPCKLSTGAEVQEVKITDIEYL